MPLCSKWQDEFIAFNRKNKLNLFTKKKDYNAGFCRLPACLEGDVQEVFDECEVDPKAQCYGKKCTDNSDCVSKDCFTSKGLCKKSRAEIKEDVKKANQKYCNMIKQYGLTSVPTGESLHYALLIQASQHVVYVHSPIHLHII